MPNPSDHDEAGEAALRRLLHALPGPVSRGYEALCRPGRGWARVPLALALIAGGFLGFLPLLGFWMVPVGVVLLAEDVPALRRPTLRALAGVQGWWDRVRKRAKVRP